MAFLLTGVIAAKHITRHLPQYAALVMDLRGHGGSSSSRGRRFPPPHNFDACAQDVVETLKQLGLTREKSPFAIVGHSLGGRVALQYSSLLSRDSATIGVNAPSQTYLLDTVPGQADPSVHSVLKAISSFQTPIESKASLVDTMMKEYRISKPVAAWIASNVYRTENGLDWVFDLDVANELVSNFSDQNLVEQIADVSETPSKPLLYQSMTYDAYQDNCDASQVHLVVGGKNKLWTSDVLEDLRSVPSFGTSKNSMFQMHTLDDAGHWVHVDCLEGLVKVLVDNLLSRMHTVLSDDDH